MVTLTVRSKYTDFFYLYHERGLVKRLKNFNLKLRHKTVKILYNMFMEHEGYSVLQAADGRTALELFESDTPDILLLDIMLSQLNGLEVLRRIRKTSSVPVIMLTARGETFDKVSGLDSGADDYLAKPFEIGASNLDERLPVTDKGDDFDELAKTFNNLLSRLQTDFARERQFTADVSHELKTPLAVILGHTNLLRR